MTVKPKRKYSKFQVPEPDCKARFGGLVITVFNLNSEKPKIEYNKKRVEIPSEIKQAVKIWIKHGKYGGLSLTEYLNSIYSAKDYA